MKTFPAGLDTLLATGSYVFCDLYDFTLMDGSHLYYTTADTDVLYNGNVYTSKGPFFDQISSQSRAHWKAGLDLDTWQITIAPAVADPVTGVNYPAKIFNQPWLTAVRAGALDGATVDIHRAYWPAWPTWTVTPAPPPYFGPGDIVGGATQWFGLRAYRSATIGTNAIRLRRDNDNTEQNFVTITGGGLDLTSITAFKGAANLFVRTLYDQTGNGYDIGNATAATQPAFILNALGTLPAIYFNVANNSLFTAASLSPLPFPTAVSTVFNTSGSGAPATTYAAGSLGFLAIGTGTNSMQWFAPALTSATTFGQWYAAQVNYQGNVTTSDARTNGVDVTATLTAENRWGGTILGNSGFGTYYFGYGMEFGIWTNVAFSGAQEAALETNQRTYYGF